jgi:hypothetical protein
MTLDPDRGWNLHQKLRPDEPLPLTLVGLGTDLVAERYPFTPGVI